MRRSPRGGALVLAAAAALSGCAVTAGSPRQSVGETILGISASNTIQIRYQADPVLAPLGLRVRTYRREVFVSGPAQNEAQRARALAIARDTPGILDAYFADTDLPGRPVSRAHYEAGAEAVWTAMVAAVRAAGYQIARQQVGRSLETEWRFLPGSWATLGLTSRERVRLALYAHGDIVTVIAVADRLDGGSLPWQIEREEAMLRNIRKALGPPAPPRP